jgi:flagellar biosynthesis protein FlhA
VRAKGNQSVGEDKAAPAQHKGGFDEVYESMSVEPVEVKLGAALTSLVDDGAGLFMDRVGAFRKKYALESGFVVPAVRFRDDPTLPGDAYEIRVFGAAVGSAAVQPGRTLAIHGGGEISALPGVQTRDPTYGLPAYWIEPQHREAARAGSFTLVDSETVLLTHLNEVLRQQSAALLTRAETQNLVDRVRQRHASLVDELIPSVLTVGEVQKVLQNLLREKVSIRNLELILEVLVDSGRSIKDTQQLTELARQRLAPSICQPLIAESGYLHVLTFDPAVEQSLARSVRAAGGNAGLVLEPSFAEQLLAAAIAQVERMMKSSLVPVLLCAPELRRHVRALTERLMPHLRVLSLVEVPANVNLKGYASIGAGLQGAN